MKIVSFQFDQDHIELFSKLVWRLYKNYPLVANFKINELKKSINKNSPFFKHGHIKNFILFKNDSPVAHVSAIIDKVNPKTGLLGFFECVDDGTFAKTLFTKSLKWLKEQGRLIVRGPVNLNAWQNFRLCLSEKNPPFLFEPFNRAYYKSLFMNFGFQVAQENVSTIEKVDKTNLGSYKSFYLGLRKKGFRFYPISKQFFKRDIQKIYKIALKTFNRAWSFTPITLEEFFYIFSPLKELVDEEYILLVDNQKGQTIGFFFAFSDSFNPYKKRLILKTAAVLPKYQGAKIGHAMFYLEYLLAKKNKLSEIIFSTMREGNESINFIRKIGKIYRRYHVYELKL